jgi:hypothetical protein
MMTGFMVEYRRVKFLFIGEMAENYRLGNACRVRYFPRGSPAKTPLRE